MEEKKPQLTSEEHSSPQVATPVAPARKVFPTSGDLLAMLGIALGIQIGVGTLWVIVQLILGWGEMPQNPTTQGLVMAVSYFITMSLTLVLVLIYRRRRGGSGAIAEWSLRGLNPAMLVWAFVLIFALGIVLEPVVSLLPDPPYEAMGRGMWTLISVALFAPLFEEVLCRGVVLGALRQKYGAPAALLFSSLFFGVLHIYPAQVVGAFAIGLVLGYIYIVTRSLWAPILLHAANNGVAYVLLVMGYQDKTLSDLVSRPIFVTLYALALVVAVVSSYMVWRSLKRIREAEKNSVEA